MWRAGIRGVAGRTGSPPPGRQLLRRIAPKKPGSPEVYLRQLRGENYVSSVSLQAERNTQVTEADSAITEKPHLEKPLLNDASFPALPALGDWKRSRTIMRKGAAFQGSAKKDGGSAEPSLQHGPSTVRARSPFRETRSTTRTSRSEQEDMQLASSQPLTCQDGGLYWANGANGANRPRRLTQTSQVLPRTETRLKTQPPPPLPRDLPASQSAVCGGGDVPALAGGGPAHLRVCAGGLMAVLDARPLDWRKSLEEETGRRGGVGHIPPRGETSPKGLAK